MATAIATMLKPRHGLLRAMGHLLAGAGALWLSGVGFRARADGERPDLDYFPSREYAVVFRNWDIVPSARLARVLGVDPATLRQAGNSLGLDAPRRLSAAESRRNVEIILRRNWPLVPRAQLEALLGFNSTQLDDFLGKEIFLRALLAQPPAGLTDARLAAPDTQTRPRVKWFHDHLRQHLGRAADTAEEPRLAYINELCRAHDPADRIPGTRARSGEADLSSGWRLCLPTKADTLLQTAAGDFTDYCRTVQRLNLRVTRRPGKKTIQLSVGAPLASPDGYELCVTPSEVRVRGSAEAGVFRGLIELERRMAERGGPFLARTVETNQPAFSPRYVFSYFSLLTDVLGQDLIDPFPDGYLRQLLHQDADGVWLYTLLEDLVPSPVFSELGEGSEARLQRLRTLVNRAGRYGLKVYLYLNEPRAQFLPFFDKHPEVKGQPEGNTAALCTSTEPVQRHLRGSFEKLFRAVPGLGGVFVITASENLVNCYSHTRHTTCPRCSQRTPAEVIAQSVRCMAEGAWAADPKARFIVWDWSWHSVLGEEAPAEIIRQLPRGVGLMADFERGTVIARGGLSIPVEEYSISVIGPSPRAATRARQARESGFDFLAKIQLSTTWECGTVPFIPVPNLLFRKAAAMREAGVGGVMATWTIGSYPSPGTEAFALANWHPALDEPTALRRVATRRYGPDAAPAAVRGWTKLSAAFAEEYPFPTAAYSAPLQHGPSLPWYRHDIPPPYGKVSLFNCKDDWRHWSPPYGPDLMTRLLRHLCQRWDDGLSDLRAAVELAAPPRRRLAERDFGVAWMVGYTYRAYANALDFYQARDAGDSVALKRIAAAEIPLTEEALRRVRADSRLGWEAELQYFYRPSDILERLISLDAVVEPPP